ncbi:DUF6904 family protein [Indiicoccus explosivorum]|uniref:DUF6904 family protein n=1 Tax=Indiicoccus explosivorum TaxID=1917864 RepID=UPI000B431924|nr:hypothetical protein [Indiicoccus explosivorum]
MLAVTATPNQAGIKISGDYFDLDNLVMSFYKVIGDENKYYGYEGARMRILGICYEVRHAAQGDRNVEKVFNGLHEHIKVQHGFIAPDKNIYFSVEVLWPEALFAVVALKDFIRLYKQEAAHPEWDLDLNTVRNFQALVLDCLQGHIPYDAIESVRQAYAGDTSVEEYAVQYVDMLNLKMIDWTKEEREQNLAAVAMKIAQQDQDYQSFRQEVLKVAGPPKKPIHEVGFNKEYPDEIDW